MSDILWTSHAATHIGKIRKINQDTFLNLPEKQLWMVADGMGGHSFGELASAAIAEALQNLEPEKDIGAMVTKIYRELSNVNRSLVELANVNGHDSVIGSTVVILLARRRHCVCLWSGDSRIYLFRNAKLKQLTRDHNYLSQMLDEGHSVTEAANNSYAQTLTHAVGADPELYLDAHIQEIRPGDIYLLCSDGLNKEIDDAEIESILSNHSDQLEQAVSALMDLTLSQGARDNTTVVLAKC
ncbi:MAG: PP2C family protein-serine/threonine phosphatase [Methylosarcina sp.]